MGVVLKIYINSKAYNSKLSNASHIILVEFCFVMARIFQIATFFQPYLVTVLKSFVKRGFCSIINFSMINDLKAVLKYNFC